MKEEYCIGGGPSMEAAHIAVQISFSVPDDSKMEYHGFAYALNQNAEIISGPVELLSDGLDIQSEVLTDQTNRYVFLVQSKSVFIDLEPSFSYLRHPKITLKQGDQVSVEQYYRSALNRRGSAMVLGEIYYNGDQWVFRTMQEVVRGGIAEYVQRFKERDRLCGWLT